MPASLTVRYHRPEHVHGTVYSYGLAVEVVNSVGMSGKIFVVYRSPVSATDPELHTADTLDEFSHVATPVDLSTIPEDVPDPDRSGSSAYRTNYWEFSFRNMQDLERSLELLKSDIRLLVRSVNAESRISTYKEETYE